MTTSGDEAASGIGPELGRAARLQFLGAVARSFLLFLFQWVVARAFGVFAFGVTNLAQSGYQTATMIGRASGDTIVLRAGDDHHERLATFASAVTLSLLAGVAAAVGLYAWGGVLTEGRFESPTALSFLLAALAVPAAAVLFPLGAALQRGGQFPTYTLVVTLLEPLCRLLAIGVAIAARAHWSCAAASITIGASLALGGAAMVMRNRLTTRPTLRGAGGARRLVAFSGTTTIATALQTANLFAVLTVVTALGLPTEAGVYAAAARIAVLAYWIQGAFAAPFLPRIPAFLQARDGATLTNAYRQVVAGVLWVNGPFLVAMIVAADPILQLFGAEFAAGAPILMLLAVSQWVNSATALAQDFLPLAGRSGLALANNLGALIAVTVGGYWLGGRYGVTGVAVVAASVVVLLNTLYSVQIWKLFQAAVPVGIILRWGACAAASALPGAVLARASSGAPWTQFGVGLAAAAVTAILMWITAGAPERAALRLLVHVGRPATVGATSRRPPPPRAE